RTLSRAARLLALLQALRCRHRPVTAAALARELHVSGRTIYRDLSELAAQGAPVQGEAGVGYMLRPGLFLPPLMLTEDEAEAVLLGLRYVDQRGDDVLTKAPRNAHATILAVLPQEGQIAATLPMTIPGPKTHGFPENKVPLNALRLAIRTCRLLARNAGDAGEGGAHRGGVRAPRCADRGGGVAISVGPSLGRLGDSRRLIARTREAERCRIPSHDSAGALGGAETGRPDAGRRTDAVA